MRTTVVTSIVLMFVSISASTQTSTAYDLMQQYRYREAIEWLENQPETIENLLLKAESYERLYNHRSAISAYEKALAQDSTNLPVIINLAECQYQSGDANASLKYWTKASRLSPENIFLQTKKTIAHYRANDWKGTIESAGKVFRQDSIPLLMRMTGDAYLNLLQGDSALFYYTQTVEKNPSDHIAVHKLANFYYSARLYDEAIRVTDNYLQHINPNQKTIGQLNGMAHYSSGDYKAAIDRLKLNTELGDSTYSTSYFLGMSYYASKLYYYAVPWLMNAYSINPDDINLLYYYGTALSRTYDRKRGIEVLQEGVDKIEKFSEMLFDFDLSFANAYLKSGMHLKAIGYFNSAIKRNPERTDLLYNIAYAYDVAKDYKNALNYYERFLKTAPADFDAAKPADDTYYHVASQRIIHLKEEIFFKKDK